jgi:hypothetical protein
MLKNLILQFVATLFIVGNAFAQRSFKGTIVDTKTKSPIPYASIKVKNKKIQIVANADGLFSLSSDLFFIQDTIIITCVGYIPKSVPVKTIVFKPVVKLDPLIYQLNAVDINSKGNLNYPYQLFYELCQKYRRYRVVDHAKGYFSFLSHYDELPLEIIEGYFNGDVTCGDGIARLSLKNGRIGLSPNNFYSLSTTDIFTHFSPFSLSGNLNIPSSAGNFSFHRLKRLYDLRIIRTSIEDGNKECILQFLARKDSATLFSGLAWINRSENTIEKLECFIKVNDFYYLKPAIKGDKTDSIVLSLLFTFDNSNKEHPVISRVSLNYSLLYTSLRSSNTIKITSEGNLLFYDYTNPFAGTFPAGLIEDQDNDYQKISCLPYDSVFWAFPGITPQSDMQKLFIDYFRTNGILVNFSKCLDSIAGSNYIRWNANSDVSFSDILNRRPSEKMYLSSPGVIPSGKEFGMSPYYIICKILINPVIMGDSLHLSSVTLLNKTDSYYFLRHSFKAVTFINLTFDLYEQKRREIIAECNQINKNHKLTLDEFQLIYSKKLRQLKDTLQIFQSETLNGTSPEALVKWYKAISAKTGIDRSKLIQKLLDEDEHNLIQIQDKKPIKKEKIIIY